MTPERWERIRSLARSAFERRPDQRSAYLSVACGGDEALRAEVERLISRDLETSTAVAPLVQPGESGDGSGFADFHGTERFRLEQRLGAGAFGVVYRAYDRKRKVTVALKTLTSSTPEALYRLKREFRSLADLSHPNLVRLYELVSEGDVSFFTMELLEGVTFRDYVRPAESGAAAVDEERLRSGLWQLAEGVQALHQAGRLHRDLKPSNVLVAQGSVRILDFGLVMDFSFPGARQSSRIVGTPAYMSPEQGTSSGASEAGDWYSIGVMLYEVLTGRLPFRGAYLDMLEAKRRRPAPLPSEVAADVPADLDQLCQRLLDPNPGQRPTGRAVLQLAKPEGRRRPLSAGATPGLSPFVGRTDERRELHEAFAEVRAGGTGVVAVHGSSGIGKSALVRVFLEDLARSSPAAVLFTARCYEQESVPYKALDSIVDSLAAFIRRLPPAEADSLLPRDVMALARLFPVLKQVPAVAAARRHVHQVIDAQELRRRAFGALREFLARLGEKHPVVFFIDDLQWGDLDSAALLEEILRPPDPPCLLLVGAYRTEDIDTSPFLRHILPLRARAGVAIRFRELPLAEIAAAEAEELAERLLRPDAGALAEHAPVIARDSGGHPFLLAELARHVRAQAGRRAGEPGDRRPASAPLGLDEVIRTRVQQLPEAARRLLEAVCVAGRPVAESLAHRVARIPEGEVAGVDLLKNDRFVRMRAVGEVSLEAYHDRIRSAVLSGIAAEVLRTYHAALGREFEGDEVADPEALAFHFEAAGELARAADHAMRAAERASESLAFDHAARLYLQALRLLPAHPDAHRRRVLLADSLASAGCGPEAAAQYLDAVGAARGVEAQDLRRRAAQQLLISGHLREGLEVVEALLQAVGMSMPRTRGRALASLLWYRSWLRLRGTSFRARAASQLAPGRLVRLDTCWSVTVGLTFIEPLMGAVFQARHVLMALRAGDPFRAARALAIEAGYVSTGGFRTRRRTEALLGQSRHLAAQFPNAYAAAFLTFAEGFAGYFQGRWTRAQQHLETSEQMLRESCTDVAWELQSSRLYSLRCLYYLGRARDIELRVAPLLDDVRRRGDLFLDAALRTTFLTFVALAHDDPDEASRQLERVRELDLHQRFRLQLFWDLEARVLLALYRDEGERALGAVRARARDLRQSELGRVEQNRIFAAFWRGRSALASARGADAAARRRLWRDAADCARDIHAQHTVWGDGFGHLLRAGLALEQSRREAAVTHLQASRQAFLAAEVAGAAASAALFRCGELLEGRQGQAMVREAESWFAAQGFVRPDRFVNVYVPRG